MAAETIEDSSTVNPSQIAKIDVSAQAAVPDKYILLCCFVISVVVFPLRPEKVRSPFIFLLKTKKFGFVKASELVILADLVPSVIDIVVFAHVINVPMNPSIAPDEFWRVCLELCVKTQKPLMFSSETVVDIVSGPMLPPIVVGPTPRFASTV